ncbi:MAG: hypothetical protein Q9204_004283 [Flavoplaca sp. TL-2023a]
MDQAAKGAAALEAKNFSAAVTHYTEALAINSQAVNYYIQRSTAYTRISPPDYRAALSDAEVALTLASKRGKRELIIQAQLRRAIALFSLDRYADAKAAFDWVKEMNKDEKSLQIWTMKVESKLKGLPEDDVKAQTTIQRYPDVEVPEQKEAKASNIPSSEPKPTISNQKGQATKAEGVQTPVDKIRHEWYQTDDTVVVSLFVKGVPKDKTTIDIQPTCLTVSFPLPTGSDYNFSLDPFCGKVDDAASTAKILSTKIEFILKKASVGEKWPSLESDAPVTTQENDMDDDGVNEAKRAVLADRSTNVGPSYPTSSKSGPKDWDKVADDLTKKPKKQNKEGEEGGDNGLDEEFEEEGDAVNGFFKQLYSRADPDTRRAMMKSYQESNGTTLSTNWSEVGKEKVETHPPDGMEAKPW